MKISEVLLPLVAGAASAASPYAARGINGALGAYFDQREEARRREQEATAKENDDKERAFLAGIAAQDDNNPLFQGAAMFANAGNTSVARSLATRGMELQANEQSRNRQFAQAQEAEARQRQLNDLSASMNSAMEQRQPTLHYATGKGPEGVGLYAIDPTNLTAPTKVLGAPDATNDYAETRPRDREVVDKATGQVHLVTTRNGKIISDTPFGGPPPAETKSPAERLIEYSKASEVIDAAIAESEQSDATNFHPGWTNSLPLIGGKQPPTSAKTSNLRELKRQLDDAYLGTPAAPTTLNEVRSRGGKTVSIALADKGAAHPAKGTTIPDYRYPDGSIWRFNAKAGQWDKISN